MEKIIRYPSALLRVEASTIPLDKLVPEIDEEIKKLLSPLPWILKRETNGIALAATQAGIDLAAYIVSPQLKISRRSLWFLNPSIVWASDEMELMNEGCLSLPGISAPKARHMKVRVQAQDWDGEWFEEEAEGFEARVHQHEIDHLNGKLFIDDLSITMRRRIAEKLTRR